MNFINSPIIEDSVMGPLPPSLISNSMMNRRGSSNLPFSITRHATGCYNSWEIERLKDSQIREANSVLQTQCRIQRSLYRSAMRDQGIEVSEEFLDRVVGRYTPLYTTAKEAEQIEKNYQDQQILRTVNDLPDWSRVQPALMTQHILEVEEKNLKKYEGLSKQEQYKLLQETQVKEKEDEEAAKKKNLHNYYDSSKYQSYFSDYKVSEYDKYAPSNLDDITVELPGNITRQYDEARMRFAEALMREFR